MTSSAQARPRPDAPPASSDGVASGDRPGPDGAARTPTVVHLDHATVAGGAELALRRLLDARDPRPAASGADRRDPLWHASVVVPPGDAGVFAGLDGLVQAGPGQRPGLGAGASALDAVRGMTALAATARAVRRVAAGADVVHANTSRAAAYGALAVRPDQRFVVHLRDMVAPDALGRHGFLALRAALRRADGVLACSGAALESARPYLPANVATLVLPSPLGLDAVRAVPPTPVVPGPPRVVGMVARLAPWKGQELLVDAFARAYGGTATRLRLVGAAQFGDDDVVTRVRALAARLGVTDQLDLPGHVADVAGEIAALDVCVQASTRPEPLGQNVLQYLALGRPTVVADAGGPTEWVRDGENGLAFRSGDADSLADALRALADDGLRARLAAGATATPVPTDAALAASFAQFVREVPARR